MSYIFKVMRRHKFKIDSIEKDYKTNEYLVTFVYISKRQVFIMPAKKIFENSALLNQFSPDDAMEVGMFYALSHFGKINKFKLSIN